MSVRRNDLRDRWFHHVEVGLALVEGRAGIREDVLAMLASVFWQAGWDAPAALDVLSLVKNPELAADVQITKPAP